ncbi:unnamed protein product, partial [Protopolystoma xenopodis]
MSVTNKPVQPWGPDSQGAGQTDKRTVTEAWPDECDASSGHSQVGECNQTGLGHFLGSCPGTPNVSVGLGDVQQSQQPHLHMSHPHQFPPHHTPGSVGGPLWSGYAQ